MPLPMTKYHADWFSLIEISGPFVSLPVLMGAFPQGMDVLDAELAQSFKADYEFWQENRDDPAVHSAWVRLVLESLLGYAGDGGGVGATRESPLQSGQAIPAGLKAEFPEHEETLRPSFVLVEPSAVTSNQLSVSSERKPKMLIQVFPPSQDLNKAVIGSRWAASAGTRMMELLHATEIALGLVTNGEQWMLVFAPRGETTGFASWYASLWFDERTTLNAFVSLLGVKRFFGVEEDETLENLLRRSASYQQEVTDQLGLQVRHAVEILIQTVDRIEQERVGTGLPESIRASKDSEDPSVLYEAALTVMMRLVFLLSAEEQELLPINNPVYAEHYAALTLREQLSKLADEQGEEVLERRFDAWSRLLATFRAVFGGVRHQDLTLPAYGGSLFNPNKYGFLEGKDEGGRMKDERGKDERGKERPLAIDNRTVLHLLNALQMLRVDGEMRRLSFRALDVEQIGHVYEGLLDHKAARASEVMLGLGGAKRLEPEIPLSKLEQARARGEASLEALLKDETQKSLSALKNALAVDIQKDALKLGQLRTACGNDESLLARALPFAGLIRADDFGHPAVILAGSVYVTAGTTRRATGTHYTPRSFTEPVVQHTLEPLVYAGVAEGLPREEWTLRAPAELLALKICDMAMGSGGFLVQVVRYLAERLVESWALYPALSEVEGWEEGASTSLSAEDLLNYARRLVAERCIYGVDKNPLAVEIAKLSVWLVTLAKERPFTFLDHALKCGDSLVGASEDDFLRWARGYKDSAMTLFDAELAKQLETARGKRRELEGFVVRDVQDAERKEALLREADLAMEHVKRGADLLTGARLLGLRGEELEAVQSTLMLGYMAGELDGAIDPNKHYDADRALTAAKKENVFHWEFEFPEVFEHGGFSAFVGNPPFVGGQRIKRNLGDYYQKALQDLYSKTGGNVDLCTFFFLKAFQCVNQNGVFGLIATNTISQGDTREAGLDQIVSQGGIIYRATNNYRWPGVASVSVSIIFISKKKFEGGIFLDDKPVNIITSLLDNISGLPNRLNSNGAKSYIGSYILGLGFTMSPEEASILIEKEKNNTKVLFPYINGENFNDSPDQTPNRWIINFTNMTLDQAEHYKDCIEIVKEKVLPQRLTQKEKNGREKWWLYMRSRPELYSAIQDLKRVLVVSQISKYQSFGFLPKGYVYDQRLVVFAFESSGYFAQLQSSIHNVWSLRFGATLETRPIYTPTDCFENYPLVSSNPQLEEIGERYHEHRRQIMLSRQEGLTSTYNRFHNPEEESGDIVRLRELHVEMDNAVAAAYGWGEEIQNSEFRIQNLEHGFHETAQGIRFTVSESARREVLSRLLKLNHERWEEEQRMNDEGGGMKEKPKKAARKKSKSDAGQMGLL